MLEGEYSHLIWQMFDKAWIKGYFLKILQNKNLLLLSKCWQTLDAILSGKIAHSEHLEGCYKWIEILDKLWGSQIPLEPDQPTSLFPSLGQAFPHLSPKRGIKEHNCTSVGPFSCRAAGALWLSSNSLTANTQISPRVPGTHRAQGRTSRPVLGVICGENGTGSWLCQDSPRSRWHRAEFPWTE